MKCRDTASAHLKLEMTEADAPVHMKIDPYQAGLLAQIDPEYKEYRMNNGEAVVKLDRALCTACVKLERSGTTTSVER